MENTLHRHLNALLPGGIRSVRALSGGDISKVYMLDTPSGNYLLKTHAGAQGFEMLQAEQLGLKALAATGAIRTPEVLYSGLAEGQAFLILECIDAKRPAAADFARLGQQLAQLHQATQAQFGFDSDNFIGSLPQSNREHADWTAFYVQERLLPQMDMAHAKGLLDQRHIPLAGRMEEVCSRLFPPIRPSLLHGDLWSGNYLIAASGEPCLIDPAVYYGHREVDLAMSRLFGGFDAAFYQAYDQTHPPQPGAAEREDLYQLYYLLAHLNLFGRAYLNAVIRIVRRYFL